MTIVPSLTFFLLVEFVKRLSTVLLFLRFYLEVSEKVLIFAPTKVMIMSKKEKEEKAKEFWEYYEATQGTITITDPVVLD